MSDIFTQRTWLALPVARGEPGRYLAAPGGRPWRPPECPDVHGWLRRKSPAGEEGVNSRRALFAIPYM